MATQQDAMTPEEQIFEHFSTTDSLFQDETSEEEKAQAAPEEEELEAEDTDIEDEEVEDEGDDEESEPEEESETPWMPTSLDELAAAMEVETDDLKSIRIKTKVDGVEGEATLAEVIKNYQLNKSLTERSEAFAHERKQFEERSQQLAKAFEEKLAGAESLTMMAEERLKREIGAIDWEQLRADDPAEYAVRRQDYMEKIGELEASKQQIMQERQEQFQKQQQEWLENRDKLLKHNQEKLLEVVPEFRDPDLRTKEVNELKSYLRSQEISDEEINNIVDYRMIVLARKAKAYDEMQTKVKPAKAKAKTKPKFTKPGSVTTKADADSSRMIRRHKRAAKTQDVDDWAAALEDRLF